MTDVALSLAATAAAAVPGLSPVLVRAVRARVGARFQVGFVEDSQHRRWVVRVPLDAVSAAAQDSAAELLGLVARRLPFAVPAPEGFVSVKGRGRAMVYPYLDGRSLRAEGLTGGPGPAADLGRTIAAVHNLDRALYEQVGLPSYDAQESRRRHLTDLDRAAGTGRVPRQLLSRWEERLDNVSLWRFAPATVHGRMAPHHALAQFDDPEDACSGRICAVLGWDRAFVGDPAEDLAAVVGTAARDAVDAVLEGYAMARPEAPDPHLEQRAELLVELRMLDDLLVALAGQDELATERAVEALRSLAEDLEADPSASPPTAPMTSPRGSSDVRTNPAGPVGEDAQQASTTGAVSVRYDPHPETDQLYQAGSPAPGIGTAHPETPPADPAQGQARSAQQRGHHPSPRPTAAHESAGQPH